eukprot:TRINITY_DN779_c0_g1_i4.p1 TRINITY_DN779_c0_g1~~TRINITY_DN779_c0_g1_i4.p1  ORF type:complete len:426 (+),score=118.62 TRINITY_DN779_c0_g1_i4:305-1582(+)
MGSVRECEADTPSELHVETWAQQFSSPSNSLRTIRLSRDTTPAPFSALFECFDLGASMEHRSASEPSTSPTQSPMVHLADTAAHRSTSALNALRTKAAHTCLPAGPDKEGLAVVEAEWPPEDHRSGSSSPPACALGSVAPDQPLEATANSGGGGRVPEGGAGEKASTGERASGHRVSGQSEGAATPAGAGLQRRAHSPSQLAGSSVSASTFLTSGGRTVEVCNANMSADTTSSVLSMVEPAQLVREVDLDQAPGMARQIIEALDQQRNAIAENVLQAVIDETRTWAEQSTSVAVEVTKKLEESHVRIVDLEGQLSRAHARISELEGILFAREKAVASQKHRDEAPEDLHASTSSNSSFDGHMMDAAGARSHASQPEQHHQEQQQHHHQQQQSNVYPPSPQQSRHAVPPLHSQGSSDSLRSNHSDA